MKIFFHKMLPLRFHELAVKNNWTLLEQIENLPNQGFLLFLEDKRLSLKDLSEPSWSSFYIDFLDSQFLLRLKKVHNQSNLLKKAIGFKPIDQCIVWDATAGLCRDSMVLAQLGYNVIAVERSVVLFELICDAIERAKNSDELCEGLSRLKLLCGDSKILLANLSEEQRPEVIYLDPMYPDLNKSSQPKKEMQILRKLLGSDDNVDELLAIARVVAKKKVILKNNPRTKLILKPKHSLKSKSVRFDVY